MKYNNNVRRLGCRFGLTLLISSTVLATAGCGMFTSKPPPPPPPAVSSEPVMVTRAEPVQVRQSESRNVRVRADHPRRYIVKKGDTLWDISSTFLKDPWFWPELWHRNPDIANPHLIFPGDIITMIYVDGKPRILVNEVVKTVATAPDTKKRTRKVVKLSPKIRRESLDASVATIPSDAIRQFITRPRVVTKEEYENAPYIIGSDDDHLILGENNRIYVRGELDKERVRYSVYRKGAKLINPENDELMGYEVIHAGEARITTYGDPASGELSKTNREVLVGDRLMPSDKGKVDHLYFPRVPDTHVEGQVISLFDSLFGVAKFQIAVINRGAREGLDVGHLLASYKKGSSIRDRFSKKRSYFSGPESVDLPDERSGLLMIFKTFDHVSYGLVLESTRVIHREDVVKTPL